MLVPIEILRVKTSCEVDDNVMVGDFKQLLHKKFGIHSNKLELNMLGKLIDDNELIKNILEKNNRIKVIVKHEQIVEDTIKNNSIIKEKLIEISKASQKPVVFECLQGPNTRNVVPRSDTKTIHSVPPFIESENSMPQQTQRPAHLQTLNTQSLNKPPIFFNLPNQNYLRQQNDQQMNFHGMTHQMGQYGNQNLSQHIPTSCNYQRQQAACIQNISRSANYPNVTVPHFIQSPRILSEVARNNHEDVAYQTISMELNEQFQWPQRPAVPHANNPFIQGNMQAQKFTCIQKPFKPSVIPSGLHFHNIQSVVRMEAKLQRYHGEDNTHANLTQVQNNIQKMTENKTKQQTPSNKDNLDYQKGEDISISPSTSGIEKNLKHKKHHSKKTTSNFTPKVTNKHVMSKSTLEKIRRHVDDLSFISNAADEYQNQLDQLIHMDFNPEESLETLIEVNGNVELAIKKLQKEEF